MAMAIETLRSEFLCNLTGLVAPPRDIGATARGRGVTISPLAALSKALACVERYFPMAAIGCLCARMAFWNRTFELP
jgi:hypothetical protein